MFLTTSELSFAHANALELLEGFLGSLSRTCQPDRDAEECFKMDVWATNLSQVLVFPLALSYEVVELRREELGGHDGLLEMEESRFMSLRL